MEKHTNFAILNSIETQIYFLFLFFPFYFYFIKAVLLQDRYSRSITPIRREGTSDSMTFSARRAVTTAFGSTIPRRPLVPLRLGQAPNEGNESEREVIRPVEAVGGKKQQFQLNLCFALFFNHRKPNLQSLFVRSSLSCLYFFFPLFPYVDK